MKKKLTAIFLCVALVAIAVVSASLAYFTDTDNEHICSWKRKNRPDRAAEGRERSGRLRV